MTDATGYDMQGCSSLHKRQRQRSCALAWRCRRTTLRAWERPRGGVTGSGGPAEGDGLHHSEDVLEGEDTADDEDEAAEGIGRGGRADVREGSLFVE